MAFAAQKLQSLLLCIRRPPDCRTASAAQCSVIPHFPSPGSPQTRRSSELGSSTFRCTVSPPSRAHVVLLSAHVEEDPVGSGQWWHFSASRQRKICTGSFMNSGIRWVAATAALVSSGAGPTPPVHLGNRIMHETRRSHGQAAGPVQLVLDRVILASVGPFHPCCAFWRIMIDDSTSTFVVQHS